MMHKNSQKMHSWLPWQYFGGQHDHIIVFRLFGSLKFGNFSFWSYDAEICGGGVVSSNFYSKQ